MKINTLRDALVHEISDLYSAEKQLVKALPQMAKAATNEELQAALEEHLVETEGQIARLDEVFEAMGEKPGREKCKAMEGLIEEGKRLLKEDVEPTVHDAMIIGMAQKVEHYEIAGYGTARTFAEILGEDDVAALLSETLDEESAADERLTDIAATAVNPEAADEEDEDE